MSERRVAVGTGGAGGIGAAITAVLARDGIHVAAGYHHNREAAEGLRDKLLAEGHSASVHQGSVGDPHDCARVVTEVLDAFGRVDHLVNNAGVTVDKTVRKMTVDDWHAVLRVNLSGAFYMTKAVLDHMLERGSGRIVHISPAISANPDGRRGLPDEVAPAARLLYEEGSGYMAGSVLSVNGGLDM